MRHYPDVQWALYEFTYRPTGLGRYLLPYFHFRFFFSFFACFLSGVCCVGLRARAGRRRGRGRGVWHRGTRSSPHTTHSDELVRLRAEIEVLQVGAGVNSWLRRALIRISNVSSHPGQNMTFARKYTAYSIEIFCVCGNRQDICTVPSIYFFADVI